MSRTDSNVDAYLRKAKKWRDETEKLRTILLNCQLNETFKWGKPCYTFQESNVAIIQGFKDSCALMFFKGALLKDPGGILEKPGENSQAGRRIRFASVEKIATSESILKAFIKEAIKVEKAGLQVSFKKNPEPVPEELQDKFNKTPALKKAFNALTPGRRRAYILHFSAAKRPETRRAQIEKCMERILSGKGLND